VVGEAKVDPSRVNVHLATGEGLEGVA
jgi:hypothetical protein